MCIVWVILRQLLALPCKLLFVCYAILSLCRGTIGEKCTIGVDHRCSGAHATWCCEHQWREGAMFNLSHAFIICSSLFQLIPSVTLSQGSIAIALHEWIEHPYIKECTLPITPPQTLPQCPVLHHLLCLLSCVSAALRWFLAGKAPCQHCDIPHSRGQQ